MLRPLRLARATRLVRFGLILTRSNRQAQASLETRAVAYVSVLAATLTLACSVAILEFEQHTRSANIRTYGDALWWAVTTVSTVGYGDRYPVTLGGRITAGPPDRCRCQPVRRHHRSSRRLLHPPRYQRPRPRRGRPAHAARTAASRRHPHRDALATETQRHEDYQ